MIKWKCISTHSGDLGDGGVCFFRGSVLPHGDVKWPSVLKSYLPSLLWVPWLFHLAELI